MPLRNPRPLFCRVPAAYRRQLRGHDQSPIPYESLQEFLNPIYSPLPYASQQGRLDANAG